MLLWKHFICQGTLPLEIDFGSCYTSSLETLPDWKRKSWGRYFRSASNSTSKPSRPWQRIHHGTSCARVCDALNDLFDLARTNRSTLMDDPAGVTACGAGKNPSPQGKQAHSPKRAPLPRPQLNNPDSELRVPAAHCNSQALGSYIRGATSAMGSYALTKRIAGHVGTRGAIGSVDAKRLVLIIA